MTVFFKKRLAADYAGLEGVITFFGSHHALKADMVLKKSSRPGVLIPGPRDISPNCGVALRIDYGDREGISSLLKEHYVQYEAIHLYPA